MSTGDLMIINDLTAAWSADQRKPGWMPAGDLVKGEVVLVISSSMYSATVLCRHGVCSVSRYDLSEVSCAA